jgi:hypothetical protein
MIQSGVIHLSAQMQGWTLNTGTGDRTFLSPDIGFQPPFGSPPKVLVALAGIDAEHAANLRVIIEAVEIENDEFNIRVNTWADTSIHSVQVAFIAHD